MTSPSPRDPLFWRLRNALSPAARQRVRRGVNVLAAPVVGSLVGADTVGAVALTFDDGPQPGVTEPLLELLADHQATATFFFLLNQTRRYPDLARLVASQGHEIGLHGVTHRRLTTLPSSSATRYLRAARDELQICTGQRVELYRPPYGSQSLSSWWAARRAGLRVVVWSCDAEDWVDRPLSDVAATGAAGLAPGGVLLLHERLEPDGDLAPSTSFDRIELVRRLLLTQEQQGRACVTVSQLLDRGRPRKTAWFRP